MFSQIKKKIEDNFDSVAGVMPQGWDLGVLGGVKNFSVGICDGAPSTAHSGVYININFTNGISSHEDYCIKYNVLALSR